VNSGRGFPTGDFTWRYVAQARCVLRYDGFSMSNLAFKEQGSILGGKMNVVVTAGAERE
jgi:hypothetical protein